MAQFTPITFTDAANRLTTLTAAIDRLPTSEGEDDNEATEDFIFGYDNANRLISKTLPNNITTIYDYDGMSRLKELKHQSLTATLTDNNFTYNTANQISQIAELTQTKTFGYDAVDRLTGTTSPTLAAENYAFDNGRQPDGFASQHEL